MRTAVMIISAALLGAAALGWWYSGRLPERVAACYESARPLLKDPETASLEAWKVEFNLNAKLEVRAVNSFGAFGRVFITCRDGGAPVVFASREEWERGF